MLEFVGKMSFNHKSSGLWDDLKLCPKGMAPLNSYEESPQNPSTNASVGGEKQFGITQEGACFFYDEANCVMPEFFVYSKRDLAEYLECCEYEYKHPSLEYCNKKFLPGMYSVKMEHVQSLNDFIKLNFYINVRINSNGSNDAQYLMPCDNASRNAYYDMLKILISNSTQGNKSAYTRCSFFKFKNVETQKAYFYMKPEFIKEYTSIELGNILKSKFEGVDIDSDNISSIPSQFAFVFRRQLNDEKVKLDEVLACCDNLDEKQKKKAKDAIEKVIAVQETFWKKELEEARFTIAQFVKTETGSSFSNVKACNLQKILFGAPGTGKSFQLNLDAAPYYEAEKNVVQKDDSEKLRKIIQDANDFSKCVAIGLKYNDVIKNQKPKQLHDMYGCSLDAGYALCQGAKIENIRKSIADVDDDKLDVSVINGELTKITKDKQASWAALGFKYSSYFFGKTTGDIQDDLGLSKTSSAASWILYGVNAAKYIDTLGEEEEKPKYVERVTFHPNYSYAQFVGTYKPIQDENDSKCIVYSYVPGPFMRTYVRAKCAEQNKTDEKFLLIIEEINRANVAAVFGDVFQLLDRNGKDEGDKKCGESSYPIAASEDIKRYLKDNGIEDCNELKIPSNMYIWATMNSADQGVFPMDTAFKRRWEFEYIGIDKNETWDYTIPLPNGESINWNVLRKAINGTLKKIASVNEDKLLGPYFLSKAVLEDANKWNSEQDSEEKQKAVEKFLNTFKSKVLMYLYEDVCKMRPGDVFKIKLEDGQTRLHYSDICDAFDLNGIKIFGFEKADIVEKYQQKKDN